MLGFPAKLAGLFPILFSLMVAMPFEKANARGAICLYDSTDIHVKNNLTALVLVQKNLLVTSESGLRYAQVIIPINDYVDVQDIKGYTELPGGRKIELSKQDIGWSTAAAPGLAGTAGARVVLFSLHSPTIGSRLFYQYKLIFKSLLYLPRITRQTEYPTSRIAVFLRWDKKIKLHYDFEGFEEQATDRAVHFSAVNLDEVPPEPHSCPDNLYLAISTDRFSYGGRKYSSESWQDIGRFFGQLSIQPPDVASDLGALSQRLNISSYDREDTLNAFFSFLADSVGYVALQMGKGDFTPQNCSLILSRRFGDCKDQSVLLSALCRLAGLDAYPALINTVDFPDISTLHPWPPLFDHVITVVRGSAGDILLDPSDPLATIESIPPRLRGKNYLVCDGFSPLKTVPGRLDPAFDIFWQFHLSRAIENILNVDFSVKYINDASILYGNLWKTGNTEQVINSLQAQLRYSGWDLISINIGGIKLVPDSLIILGSFSIDLSDIGESRSLAVASPLNVYLLDNFFVDVRQNDYCQDGSIKLEEEITIDSDIPGLLPLSGYSDSWERKGLSFHDQMNTDRMKAIYHRLFVSGGEIINALDYNAFRDFLLSRKDQQYVRFQK
jgi:hypothetical protein